MDLREKLISNLRRNNVLSQKGLIEMFDSTIGRSTVLMPFGGKTQRSETQVSVQKLPVGNHFTNTASIMAYGYNPDISSWSPYHGAQYAVVEAITKIVAAGGRYNCRSARGSADAARLLPARNRRQRLYERYVRRYQRPSDAYGIRYHHCRCG